MRSCCRGLVHADKYDLCESGCELVSGYPRQTAAGAKSADRPFGGYSPIVRGLEGLSQSLAAEVAAFGIKVALVEPGRFATDWGGPSAKRSAQMPAYDPARTAIASWRASNESGDPEATGSAILKAVDAKDPPLRIFFGAGGLPMTRTEYAKRIDTWEQRNDVSLEAHGDLAARKAG